MESSTKSILPGNYSSNFFNQSEKTRDFKFLALLHHGKEDRQVEKQTKFLQIPRDVFAKMFVKRFRDERSHILLTLVESSRLGRADFRPLKACLDEARHNAGQRTRPNALDR